MTPGPGHNSRPPSKTKPATVAGDRLKSFIERIEKLEEERKAIGGDIRDVYAEANGTGFDVRTMREIIRLRKMDAADRDERETLLDIYKQALGMLDGTPLGDAALARVGGA
jgi:uncharacterized protein (UPF0335 family)